MEEKVAPKLVPFGNPVTITIAIIVGILIIAGMILSFTNGLLGILIGTVGAFGFGFGLTKHSPSKPREAGLLTLWDAPIKIGGQCVVVGGTTILADYYPFKLGSIKIEMDNKDKNFPMTVISSDEIPLKGEVSVTACPNIVDPEDFIQAGNSMDLVFQQLADPVYQEVQEYLRLTKMKALDISLKGKEIADALHKRIEKQTENNLFSCEAFGVTLIKVRVNFPLPDDIQSEMREVEKEKYQRRSESMEYETMRLSAIDLQRELAKQYILDSTGLKPDQIDKLMKPLIANKTIPDLSKCLEVIRTQRLVKDGMVARVEGGDGSQNLNVVNPGFQFGGKGGEKKGGK